jgi:hypothetical protein
MLPISSALPTRAIAVDAQTLERTTTKLRDDFRPRNCFVEPRSVCINTVRDARPFIDILTATAYPPPSRAHEQRRMLMCHRDAGMSFVISTPIVTAFGCSAQLLDKVSLLNNSVD